MALKTYTFITTQKGRLFDFIMESLTQTLKQDIPSIEIKKLILNQKVFVNSKKTSLLPDFFDWDGGSLDNAFIFFDA